MTDQPPIETQTWLQWPYYLILCAALVLMLAYILMPRFPRPREIKPEMVCLTNLRQIGMAIAIYMSDHKGAFPADVHQCAAQAGKTSPNSDVLKCPLAPVANYIFLPENAGKDSTLPIAYEPISNHKKGASVLFADMHMAFVTKAEYEEVIARRKVVASRPG